MVQTAKNQERYDSSPRNGAVHQLRSGHPLLQPLVMPAPVEVRDVLAEYPAYLVPSEDDNVIETLASEALFSAISSCGPRRRS